MDTVKIYTTPTCGFCHMAKEYFKRKNVAYEEVDITTDSDGFKWVIDHTGQAAVPVITIGETTVIGFDRPDIDAALLKSKLI